MESETVAEERHPIRFIFKLAFFAGLIYLVGKYVVEKKDEFAGLTASEAKVKFQEKLAPRIGEDQAAEIAEQVVTKLMERGIIRPDPSGEDTASSNGGESANEETSST